jgi:hypothetical protein
MKAIVPKDKVHLLEESIDLSPKVSKEEQPQVKESEPAPDEVFQLKEQGKIYTIKRGLTVEEEGMLMQMIVDCGGILKTIVSTHDINLKDNVFLRNFFTLATDYKKECHDISNALVGLSSKIKSIH